MATGFLKITNSAVISFEQLYDNSSVTSQGEFTFNLPDLTRYNCLAIWTLTVTSNWYYFYYLPQVPSNLQRWMITCYGGGGTNCGNRAFTIDWSNNTLTQTNCRYNNSWQPGYGLPHYIYGIVGQRLSI